MISPLGKVTNTKLAGSLKHRVVQDLRRGGANLVEASYERVVLPRPSDHAWDLLELLMLTSSLTGPKAPDGVDIWKLIVDFKNVFMSSGSLPSEQKYTVAEVTVEESHTGSYVYVWCTLGFGGKAFPLGYARPASFAAASARDTISVTRSFT